MSRPPATSRKVGRALVLLALFLVCLRATQTARALLGAGAVQFPRSVPPGIWAQNLLVARRAKAGDGEAEDSDSEDVKAAPSQTAETVEDAKKGITGKKASSAKYEDEVDEVEEVEEARAGFDQDEWLQQTADQIKNFTVKQVCDWAKAVLKAKGLDEGLAAEAAQRLENEAVTGGVLIGATAQELIRDSGMKFGPAKLLVNQLQASGGSAPTAASGLQVESTLTDMALVVKAAVKEAMVTGLTVSRTALWKDAYGPDTKDQELRERTGEPVLDGKQLSSLTGQSTEKDLVAFTLPILRSLFPEDKIVDSQNRRWPESGLSPDLFRCMVYDGNASSGTPYKEMLDCVSVFEAKLAINDDSRGQLYEYLCRLPSKHARGMVFDKRGFELYHVAGQPGSRKALLERICGAWSAPGGKKLLRDFLSQYNPWERLLRQSLRQAGAVPIAFLGSGAFGRVLEAQRKRDEEIERIAIKAVLAVGVPNGFSPGAEVEVMKRACQQGCPVVAPSSDCIEVVESDKVLGWFHILGDVGTPVPVDTAQAKWRDLVEALRQLHLKGFVHGDPRLANVVLLGDKFKWIDFLGQPVFTRASQETDIQILMTDLVGQKDPVQFGQQFDGWPKNSAFIGNVLQPLMSSVTR